MLSVPIKKVEFTMAKNAKSAAAAVSSKVVASEVAAIEKSATVRGPKMFGTDDYLKQYLEEQKSGGTWATLCERTGMKENNVRQAITQLRSAIREKRTEQANNPVNLKALKNAGKDVETWVEEQVNKSIPPLAGSGTRNTAKAKLLADLVGDFEV